MSDYPPKDYSNNLKMAKIRGIYETLVEAVSRIGGDSIVISSSLESQNIELRNNPRGDKTGLSNSVYVPRNMVGGLGMFLALEADGADYFEVIKIDDTFRFRAGQAPQVIEAMVDAAKHTTDLFNWRAELPFYARIIHYADPINSAN